MRRKRGEPRSAGHRARPIALLCLILQGPLDEGTDHGEPLTCLVLKDVDCQRRVVRKRDFHHSCGRAPAQIVGILPLGRHPSVRQQRLTRLNCRGRCSLARQRRSRLSRVRCFGLSRVWCAGCDIFGPWVIGLLTAATGDRPERDQRGRRERGFPPELHLQTLVDHRRSPRLPPDVCLPARPTPPFRAARMLRMFVDGSPVVGRPTRHF